MELWIFLWLGLSIVTAVAANARGRSGIAWFFIAAIFSPLLGLVAVLVMRDLSAEQASATRSEALKTCPQCAEQVMREARLCRFCQHEFVAAAPAPSRVHERLNGSAPTHPLTGRAEGSASPPAGW